MKKVLVSITFPVSQCFLLAFQKQEKNQLSYNCRLKTVLIWTGLKHSGVQGSASI